MWYEWVWSVGIGVLEELGASIYRDLFYTKDGGTEFLRNVNVHRPTCVLLHCRKLILMLSPILLQSNFCFQGRVQTHKCSWTAAWCGRQYACGAEGSAEEQYLCWVCESKTGPDPTWDKAVLVQHCSSLVGACTHCTDWWLYVICCVLPSPAAAVMRAYDVPSLLICVAFLSSSSYSRYTLAI